MDSEIPSAKSRLRLRLLEARLAAEKVGGLVRWRFIALVKVLTYILSRYGDDLDSLFADRFRPATRVNPQSSVTAHASIHDEGPHPAIRDTPRSPDELGELLERIHEINVRSDEYKSSRLPYPRWASRIGPGVPRPRFALKH